MEGIEEEGGTRREGYRKKNKGGDRRSREKNGRGKRKRKGWWDGEC